MKIQYPAIITFSASDKRYTVEFPDFPETATEGETESEALFNASEALTLTLEGRIDEGIDIPLPSNIKASKKVHLIAPSARVQAALLIMNSKDDFSKAEIARMLNTSWPAVARLENPHHWPSLRQLERFFLATGKQLILSVEA